MLIARDPVEHSVESGAVSATSALRRNNAARSHDLAAHVAIPSSAEAPLLATLERFGVGAVLLDANARVTAFNTKARKIFQTEVGLSIRADECEWASRSMRALLAGAQDSTSDRSATCMTIQRDDRRDLILQKTQVSSSCCLILLIDLDSGPRPRPEVLQRMFGLTSAEANLAIQISSGASPTEIARANRVSIATVRSQLASVFSKTETGRQLELASLLSRMALLS
jgi:DNA-binding CsgD family transcriptional regulator